MKLLVISRKVNGGTDADNDKVYVFNLTSPYDISTCTIHAKTENLDSSTLLTEVMQEILEMMEA